MTTRRSLLVHCTLLALAQPLGALAAPTPQKPVVLVVGDSLSAEYGIARGKGWVALLDQRLAAEKIDATVVNASISGDTTSGGLARLPAALQRHRPAIVVIELGGNDALRGTAPASTRSNLAAMARLSRDAGAKVLIVGMQMPPNYGRKYGEDFSAMFAAVAKQERASLVPFLLAGVADGPTADAMFQPDRIHPLAKAHPQMLDNVWAGLRPLLK